MEDLNIAAGFPVARRRWGRKRAASVFESRLCGLETCEKSSGERRGGGASGVSGCRLAPSSLCTSEAISDRRRSISGLLRRDTRYCCCFRDWRCWWVQFHSRMPRIRPELKFLKLNARDGRKLPVRGRIARNCSLGGMACLFVSDFFHVLDQVFQNGAHRGS